jgi:glycosyltransferase involved in cell wall biosynthesis
MSGQDVLPNSPPGEGEPINPVSVVIPTFGREQVLIDTIALVLKLDPAPAEILVIDQTPRHEPATACALQGYHEVGAIRWIRLARPSIPASMNLGLSEAKSPIVLFLDDDVLPAPGLIRLHAENYAEDAVWAVTGQVLQPGETPVAPGPGPDGQGLWRDLLFRFCSTSRRAIANCIACNLSVLRGRALELGGFDQNFVGVAFRFETEFCRRLIRGGGTMMFDPRASIRHLRAPRGGTRAYGDHLTSARPEHSVGEYYFALRHGPGWERVGYIAAKLCRRVCTRFHLRHPWWIPSKAVGEVRGLLWALRLNRAGPRYVSAGGAPAPVW